MDMYTNDLITREELNEKIGGMRQKIEVDEDGNVDILLRLFGDLGLDEMILIEDNKTPNNNDHT